MEGGEGVPCAHRSGDQQWCIEIALFLSVFLGVVWKVVIMIRVGMSADESNKRRLSVRLQELKTEIPVNLPDAKQTFDKFQA